MNSRKSLITALAATGLISGLGFAYAQSSDDMQPPVTETQQQLQQVPQEQPAGMNQPQVTDTTTVPPVQTTPPVTQNDMPAQTATPTTTRANALPQSTTPQYNSDAPINEQAERAPRADRN